MATNPLRAVFWDTYNATRKDNDALATQAFMACNALLQQLQWIGSARLAPQPGEGRRKIGQGFLMDAEGRVYITLDLALDVRDFAGALPDIQALTFKVRLVLHRLADSFAIASQFGEEGRYFAGDASKMQELAQEILRGLEPQVREAAEARASS